MSTHSTVPANATLFVEAVLREIDGTPTTDADVRLMTLVDRRGSAVTGVTLPLNMVHVENGLYRAVIPHTSSMQANRWYRGRVECVNQEGYVRNPVEIIRCVEDRV